MSKLLISLLCLSLLGIIFFWHPLYGQELQPGQQVPLIAGCLILDDLKKFDDVISTQKEEDIQNFLASDDNECGTVDPRIPFTMVEKVEIYTAPNGIAFDIWKFKAPDGKPVFASNRNKEKSGEQL